MSKTEIHFKPSQNEDLGLDPDRFILDVGSHIEFRRDEMHEDWVVTEVTHKSATLWRIWEPEDR